MHTRHTKGPGKHGYCRGGKQLLEYKIWSGLFQRCYNVRCREYPYYGGRGIAVCDRWREANGFVNFLEDVGRQPFRRASLNRIDNDGPYAPGNVRWSDQKMQMRNTRANRVLTHDGKSMPLVEWAEALGVKEATLSQRLFKGWSDERDAAGPAAQALPRQGAA